MEIILFSIGILVLLVLIAQSIMLYKVYRKENPKLDIDSKAWIAFVDLFKEHKIQKGYIVGYVDDEEEFMIHFNGSGSSHDYYKGKYLLKNLHFEYGGMEDFYGEKVPARMASYNLNVEHIVQVSQIEEYLGEYRNTDNERYVILSLKNGNKVQLIFDYMEE